MRRFSVLALFLTIVFALGVSQAATTESLSTPYCILTGTNISFSTCVSDAIPVAMVGVLFSIVLVAVAFMVGNILNVSGLNNWYKNELKETAKSILIVFSIFSVFTIMSGLAASLISSPSSSPSTSPTSTCSGLTLPTSISSSGSLGKMYTTLETQYFEPELCDAQLAYSGMFGLYEGLGFLKSFYAELYFPFPVLPVGVTVFTVDTGVDETIYQSSLFTSSSNPVGSFFKDFEEIVLIPIMFLLSVQGDMLPYIIAGGLGILIPIGIFLRAIPFLRFTGATFIALGIGVSLVYPALLLFFNMPLPQYLVPPVTTVAAPTFTCSTSGLNYLLCVSMNTAINDINSWFSTVTDFAYIAWGLGNGLLSISSIYPAFNMLLSQAFMNMILQFILFVFDLIIGYVIVQNIASILGGKVSLGIGRLKLA